MHEGWVHERGWVIGKFEDVCKELNEWNLDLIGVTNAFER